MKNISSDYGHSYDSHYVSNIVTNLNPTIQETSFDNIGSPVSCLRHVGKLVSKP